MAVIPVPEIVVVLVAAAIMLTVRSFFKRSPETTNTDHLRARLMALCIVFAIISVPLIMELVPPNGVYCFRTRETQSSRAIWYAANAFQGWVQLAGAIAGGVVLIVLPPRASRWSLWAAFAAPVAGVIVASFVYLSRLG